MGDLVPFRGRPPAPTGGVVTRAARAIARVEHPAGSARAPFTGRNPAAQLLRIVLAIGDMRTQRQHARTAQAMRLQAEYLRRQQPELGPTTPRALPRTDRGRT